MIVGESLDVMAQRPHAAGRDDAGLAHRAAEHLAVAARLADVGGGAGEHAAHRRAQALRQVDADGVHAAAQARASMPVATTALSRRAPSMCVRRPRA